MKKLFTIFFIVLFSANLFAADEKFVDCGPGFVMQAGKNRDGVPTIECQRLWCKDLENGKSMGAGNTPLNGYKITTGPNELCDYNNEHCIECFGDRKWCPAETTGIFNAEFGVYTKAGADETAYKGNLTGNCYRWQLKEHNCQSGQTAIVVAGNWVCTNSGPSSDGHSSIKPRALRRTSVMTPIHVK